MLSVKHKSSGFTLIELLIVIIIIGVLAVIFLANYAGVRERARDSRRKSDLRQIQAAFELYRYDQKKYPASLPDCSSGSSLTGGSKTYMQKIPCDPQGTTYYNNGKYFYFRNASTGTYFMCACLENINDSQAVNSPLYNQTCTLNGALSACPSTYYYFLQSQ